MTPEQFNMLRQPLLDELQRARETYERNTVYIRAELVRLQELYYTIHPQPIFFDPSTLSSQELEQLANLPHVTELSAQAERAMRSAGLTLGELACAGPSAPPRVTDLPHPPGSNVEKALFDYPRGPPCLQIDVDAFLKG